MMSTNFKTEKNSCGIARFPCDNTAFLFYKSDSASFRLSLSPKWSKYLYCWLLPKMPVRWQSQMLLLYSDAVHLDYVTVNPRLMALLPRDARSASAVLLLYVVRPSVCPSVCSECCRRSLKPKQQLRHRVVSLRQHGFLNVSEVIVYFLNSVDIKVALN